jgi:hypothetical protein
LGSGIGAGRFGFRDFLGIQPHTGHPTRGCIPRGFGFRILDFRLSDWGSELARPSGMVSPIRWYTCVCILGLGVGVLGFRVSGSGFRVPGSAIRAQCWRVSLGRATPFGCTPGVCFWDRGWGFRVSRFRVPCFELGSEIWVQSWILYENRRKSKPSW